MPGAAYREAGPLTLDGIVDAAAELIENEGLEGLTMRRLAQRCGASPMALYRHVADKQELLHAVVERQLADVELPDTEGMPWREAITQVVMAIHREFLAHPHLSEVLAVQHVDAIAIFRGTEVILQALRSAGLDEREAVRALDTITSCATGFTQRKAELRRRATAPDERLRRIRQLPPDEFGAVIEHAGLIVTVDLDHDLGDGLALVLDGIERRIERGRG